MGEVGGAGYPKVRSLFITLIGEGNITIVGEEEKRKMFQYPDWGWGGWCGGGGFCLES